MFNQVGINQPVLSRTVQKTLHLSLKLYVIHGEVGSMLMVTATDRKLRFVCYLGWNGRTATGPRVFSRKEIKVIHGIRSCWTRSLPSRLEKAKEVVILGLPTSSLAQWTYVRTSSRLYPNFCVTIVYSCFGVSYYSKETVNTLWTVFVFWCPLDYLRSEQDPSIENPTCYIWDNCSMHQSVLPAGKWIHYPWQQMGWSQQASQLSAVFP